MMCSLRIGDCLRSEALGSEGFPRRIEWLIREELNRFHACRTKIVHIPHHVIAALVAPALVNGCTRAPVNDVISSRSDERPAATSSRETADSAAASASTRLLPAADALDDGVVAARIRAEMLLDPALSGADISVNTSQRVVSLTGVVASREQAAIASAHAQAQDGVMRVDDHLAVDLR
jgi:hyperosmotically inducible protein